MHPRRRRAARARHRDKAGEKPLPKPKIVAAPPPGIKVMNHFALLAMDDE